MKRILKLFFLILCVISAAALLGGFIGTWLAGRSDEQQLFAAGTLPAPLPDGFFAGSADVQGRWKGKQFDRAQARGINIFSARTGDRQLYPFRTSVGKGLRDTEKDVLQIDYDLEGNPFWLRPALDEVVQVEPGMLLGKLHYRLIPGFPFTITFFRLAPGPVVQ